MYLLPGTELNNRYVIEDLLGHGGFGITYAAYDKVLNVRVAIKEYLPRQLATRGEAQTKVSIFTGEARQQYDYGLRKFLEEAQSIARFAHHPNVVSARDFFEANGTAYMVMEYVEGVTLKEYLEKKGGRISFEEVQAIIMPVMDALREVHQAGLLHRDISPDNIYITTSAQVKILDFGAARYFAGEQSKSLSVILKPGYAPEEQYRTAGKQGAWTDVYAVGATIYKALTGKTPPDALDRKEEDALEPPSRLGVMIPPNAEQALLKALAVSASQRFQTMGEFQQALQGDASMTVAFPRRTGTSQPAPEPGLVPGAPPSPSPVVPPPSLHPAPQSPPYSQVPRRSFSPAAIAAGVGAGGIGLVLLIGFIWWQMGRPPSPITEVPPPTTAVQKPVAPQPVPLDVGKAMTRVYGNYDARRRVSLWRNIKVPKNEKFSNLNNITSGIVKILLAQSFEEGGIDKFFLITSTVPDKADYSCHACAPLLGGVIFAREGGDWSIQSEAKYLVAAGAYGEAPNAKLAKIGADKYGVIFTGADMQMGYSLRYMMIAAPVHDTLKMIFDQVTGEDNGGVAPEGKNDKNYFDYRVEHEFVPGGNKSYYDIRTKATGTKQDDRGRVLSANSLKTYIFSKDKYVLATQTPTGEKPVPHETAALPSLRTPASPAAPSSAPFGGGDIGQVINLYYSRVQNKDVDGAINLYAAERIPKIKRKLIEAVARDTEYYRFADIKVIENDGKSAKAQVYLFHKKYQQPEEKWDLQISLVKEREEWRIWSTPGKRVY